MVPNSQVLNKANHVTSNALNLACRTIDNKWSRFRFGSQLKTAIAGTVTALSLLFGILGTANAADVPLTLLNGSSSTSFSCNTLYAAEAGEPTSRARVFSVDISSANGSTVPITPLYRPTSNSYGGEPFSTIALGPNGPGGALTMFHWYWGTWGSSHQVTVVSKGATSGTALTPRPPTPGTGSYNYWSGGEVRQSTGEIVFSGGEDSTFNNNFRMMIYNPVTGSSINSGKINPQTSSDSIVNSVYISSDMAIDAEGNMYVIAGSGSKYLVRIVPGATGAWTYNIVRQLTGLGSNTDVWGMAFLNGKLYLNNAPDYVRSFYEVDVLTGTGKYLGILTPSSGGYYYIDDLASCQTAPVIKGKIYNDTMGTGQITGSETGLSGISVEIWKEESGTPVYKGTVTTSGSGEYSYIVDSTSATYYIRVKQPKIDSQNVMQTWASAGGISNKVTAYCVTSAGNNQPMTSNGVCYGAKAGGSDPTSTTDITATQFYTKVQMSSDQEVATASFAFTVARKYGDAPNTFGTTKSSNGPSHISGPIYLGNTFAINADGQPSEAANSNASDDGVFVVINGQEVSLQDAYLTPGTAYTFRAKTSGTVKDKGVLSAWIGWSGSSATTTFTTKIANDVATTGGVAEFTYTIPGASGLTAAYARFRASTTKGLGATDASKPTPSDTVPWAIDGEVEDYRFYVTNGSLVLSTQSNGGVGKFDYTLTNISGTAPSTTTDSLTTTTENTVVTQSASVVHAYQTPGTAITITQTSPNTNWGIVAAVCKVNNTTITTTLNNSVLTIPGASVTAGSTINCEFTNGYLPKVTLVKSVTSRFKPADQFTVQLKDSSGTVLKNATTTGAATSATTGEVQLTAANVEYTLDEIMAAGSVSALPRYSSNMTCINSSSNSSTTLPTGAGQSFKLTPTYGDNITCTLANNGKTASTTTSTISADPTSITADGTMTSTIKVTLKDASGVQLPVGGDTVVIVQAEPKIGEVAEALKDNGDGTYTVKYKSTKSGEDKFTYTVNGTAATGEAKVTYTAGAVDLTTSTITVDPTSIVADGSTQSKVTVQLKDAHGNNLASGNNSVTGVEYAVALVFDGTQLGEMASGTLSLTYEIDGKFVGYISSKKSGIDKIGFTVDSQAGSNKADLTYTVGKPDAVSSVITANPTSIVADGTILSTLTVQLKDKYGNNLTSSTDPATNQLYQVKVIFKDGTTQYGDLSASTTSAGNDGKFTATVTSKKTGTDSFTFTITVDGSTSTSSSVAQVTYTPGTADLTQ